MEVAVLDVQVSRAHRLRSETVEQRNLRPGRNAQVRVLQTLLLLRRLRDHFYPMGMKDADVRSVAVEHLEAEHEVFPLVTVADEEGLGGAVVLPVEVELLHLLVGVADANEGAQLAAVLRLPLGYHLLTF